MNRLDAGGLAPTRCADAIDYRMIYSPSCSFTKPPPNSGTAFVSILNNWEYFWRIWYVPSEHVQIIHDQISQYAKAYVVFAHAALK